MNRPTEAQRMCSGSRELFPRFGNFGCTLGGTMGKGREPQSPVQRVHKAEIQPGVGGDAGNSRLAHKARPARVRRRICGERHRRLGPSQSYRFLGRFRHLRYFRFGWERTLVNRKQDRHRS
jgi:hypothetical protein